MQERITQQFDRYGHEWWFFWKIAFVDIRFDYQIRATARCTRDQSNYPGSGHNDAHTTARHAANGRRAR
ncbi:MAG: hypothetical protein U5R49_18270 [Deltaproteobacteria bacterium]|nr:hypothetical protein [Deltaproteobacteria bacterium]